MKNLHIVKQMEELRQFLDEQGIDWYDFSDRDSDYWMCRTKFSIGDTQFSVINGVGSYGGQVFPWSVNNGLLEMMKNGRVTGNLMACDIIKEINKCRKQERG